MQNFFEGQNPFIKEGLITTRKMTALLVYK